MENSCVAESVDAWPGGELNRLLELVDGRALRSAANSSSSALVVNDFHVPAPMLVFVLDRVSSLSLPTPPNGRNLGEAISSSSGGGRKRAWDPEAWRLERGEDDDRPPRLRPGAMDERERGDAPNALLDEEEEDAAAATAASIRCSRS